MLDVRDRGEVRWAEDGKAKNEERVGGIEGRERVCELVSELPSLPSPCQRCRFSRSDTQLSLNDFV